MARSGFHCRRQPHAVPESTHRPRAVHAGRSRRSMRPAAARAAVVCARCVRSGHPRLRQRHCRRDESGARRSPSARHGREDGGVHSADQLRKRHAVDRHGVPLHPRRRVGFNSCRRQRGAELRTAGVAAAGGALVRGAGDRQGDSGEARRDREGASGLLQTDHRARARPDRSDHRTQHGPDGRSRRPSLRHHARAVGRLCRRKPPAVGACAGERLPEGRGRDRVCARRQILRSR